MTSGILIKHLTLTLQDYIYLLNIQYSKNIDKIFINAPKYHIFIEKTRNDTFFTEGHISL